MKLLIMQFSAVTHLFISLQSCYYIFYKNKLPQRKLPNFRNYTSKHNLGSQNCKDIPGVFATTISEIQTANMLILLMVLNCKYKYGVEQ
jgi:hypothetical protein